MNQLPKINLVVATYFPPGEMGELRRRGFRECLESWDSKLHYDGDIKLIVANDGYPVPSVYPEWKREQFGFGHHRNGLGSALNMGIRRAFEESPLVLNIVDDAVLTEPIDLTPWAMMLMDTDAIGAVRLMFPHPGLTGTITPLRHGWGIVLDRHNVVCGLRPALYHKRFFDTYGWFDEGISAWETERLFNERFCQSQGPAVILALPIPWRDSIGASVILGNVNPITEATP